MHNSCQGIQQRNWHTRMSFLFLLFFILIFPIRFAFGWHGRTHVYLALETFREIVEHPEQKIPIYAVDYEGGKILTTEKNNIKTEYIKIGDYEADPSLLSAIKHNFSAFKAGAVGLDFFPDWPTAQMIIHPDNSKYKSTLRLTTSSGEDIDTSDRYLRYLWKKYLGIKKGQFDIPFYKGKQEDDEEAIRAFLAGCLMHSCGDVFGHAFINNYSGGVFDIGGNAAKHFIMEHYIDKRTPSDIDDFFTISLKGVKGFVYEYMIRNPYKHLRGFDLDVSYDLGKKYTLLVPRVFGALKNDVNVYVVAWKTLEANRKKEYDAAYTAWDGCSTFLHPIQKLLLAKTMGEKLKEYYIAAGVRTYLENWTEDIDTGLEAWVELWEDLGKEVFFSEEENKYDKLKEIVKNYMGKYGFSMLGAPDLYGWVYLEAIPVAKKIHSAIILAQQIYSVYEEVMDEDFDMALLKASWYWILPPAIQYVAREAAEEIWEYYENPENHFDDILHDHTIFGYHFDNNGEKITLKDFNNTVLLIDDEGYSDPSLTYDWKDIPPMYNSVTLMKLSLMSRDGLLALAEDLKKFEISKTDFAADIKKHGSAVGLTEFVPIGLGFVDSMDGDDYSEGNDWCVKNMIFGGDPCAYQALFMKQIGQPAEFYDRPQNAEAMDFALCTRVTPLEELLGADYPEDETTAADSVDTALLWETGDPMTGRLNHPGDIDYYSYTASQSGIYTVTLKGMADDDRVCLSAQRDPVESIATSCLPLSERWSNPPRIMFNLGNGETIHLRVSLSDKAERDGQTYTLGMDCIPDPMEPNNDFDNPARWDFMEGPIQGYIWEMGDTNDYYLVTVPDGLAGGLFTVKLEGLAADLSPRIYVYYENKRLVAESEWIQSAAAGAVETTFSGRAGDTFYIRLHQSKKKSTLPYTLSLLYIEDAMEWSDRVEDAVEWDYTKGPIHGYFWEHRMRYDGSMNRPYGDSYRIRVPESEKTPTIIAKLDDVAAEITPTLAVCCAVWPVFETFKKRPSQFKGKKGETMEVTMKVAAGTDIYLYVAPDSDSQRSIRPYSLSVEIVFN